MNHDGTDSTGGEAMPAETPSIRRAGGFAEIAGLFEMCKAGQLFEVQAWIAEGKPVNPPEASQGGL